MNKKLDFLKANRDMSNRSLTKRRPYELSDRPEAYLGPDNSAGVVGRGPHGDLMKTTFRNAVRKAAGLALAASLCAAPARAVEAPDVEKDVRDAFKALAALTPMNESEQYSLPARGRAFTGGVHDYQRRRSPEEILAGGLSSGDGDYAAAFYGLLRGKGYKRLLFVDSVELSVSAILSKFSGHTAVAVRDGTGKWLLADPSGREIINRDWDPASRLYRTPRGPFWAGYTGSLEKYPYNTPHKLAAFYAETLQAVPREVWNEQVVRLRFAAAPDLAPLAKERFGIRMRDFMADFSAIYDKFGLKPKTYVQVTLARGEDGVETECKATEPGAIECRVGRASDPDDNLFRWIERHELAGRFDELRPQETPPGGFASGGIESGGIALSGAGPGYRFIPDKSCYNADGSWTNPFLQEFLVRYGSVGGTVVYIKDTPGTVSGCEWEKGKLICSFGRGSGLGDEVYALVRRAMLRGK